MSGSLLVPRQDEFEVWRVVNGVKDRQDGTARIPEHMLHTMSQHHFVEDLATRKPDEGIIHGGRANGRIEGIQRRELGRGGLGGTSLGGWLGAMIKVANE